MNKFNLLYEHLTEEYINAKKGPKEVIELTKDELDNAPKRKVRFQDAVIVTRPKEDGKLSVKAVDIKTKIMIASTTVNSKEDIPKGIAIIDKYFGDINKLYTKVPGMYTLKRFDMKIPGIAKKN